MQALAAALGPGDTPEGWEPIAAAFARSTADSRDLELLSERYLLDLLLAERPSGVLADLPGRDELLLDALERARALGGYTAGFEGCALAEQLFRRGRLTAAERTTAWLLQELASLESFAMPAARIRNLRAELAYKTGRWREMDLELATGEGVLAIIAPYAKDPQYRDYRPVYLADLARLRSLQARVQFELGLLDRAGDLLDEAERAAKESGDANAEMVTLLARVDYLLLAERFQEALDLVQPVRLAGGPLAPILLAIEGLASLQLEREGWTPDPSAAKLFREVLGSGSLDVAEHFTAQVRFADALCLERARRKADADDVLGFARWLWWMVLHDPELHVTLALTRQVADETRDPDGRPLEDEGLLAVLEWRCGCAQGSAEARQVLLQAYEHLLSAWLGTAHRPQALGFLYQRRRVISAVVDADLAAAPGEEGKRAALERLFEVQGMGSLARELDLGKCTLDAVRAELLSQGEGCLVFLPSADASHLFTFDGSTLEHYSLPPLDVLQPLVTAARSRKGRDGDAAARSLRDALLPLSARAWIESHHALTLAGFGLLPGVQVEELPDWAGNSEAPRELGARFAITSLPSVPLGLWLARRAQARSEPAGGLVLAVNADPRGAAGLEPFDFGDVQRRALSAPFPDAQTRYIADASRGDLEELAGERHSIVHVLCHGAWDRNEAVCALVLASDEGPDLVRPADLPALDADVLILTACDAERGPLRLGDDLSATLGGRALVQGASCVLVADGRVEVDAALRMSEQLTRELAAGASPAEALRQAIAALPEQAARARYRVLGLGHAR